MKERTKIPTATIVACAGTLVLLLAVARGGSKVPEIADLPKKLVIAGADFSDEALELREMPTPNDLFELIDVFIGEGDREDLTQVQAAADMVDKHTKAFNFGMYASDLAYASRFGLNVEVIRYYLAMKQLGEELSLGAAFDANDLRMLEKHLSNGDSLTVLSDSYYRKAYEQLRDEGQELELAMVLAGGWIETTHLVLSRVQNADDDLGQRLTDQKLTLEQLLRIMLEFEDEPGIEGTRNDLISILGTFDALHVERAKNDQQGPTKQLVLSSDKQRRFTESTLKELRHKVGQARSRMLRDGRSNNSNA